MKTIKERLQELPDGYRELAMKYENEAFQEDVESSAAAICGFTIRENTAE
jgi:hypothetical protein